MILDIQGDVRDQHIKLLAKIQSFVGELNEIGCFYKDWNFEIGLVDFPARIHGKDVFLCWRSDEPEVLFYHGIEDGFAGRKPIPPALLAIPSKRE